MKKIKNLFFFLIFSSSLIFAEIIQLPALNKPSIISVDIQEDSVKFFDFSGKYILLEFFGTRCPMCKMEIEHLKNLQKNPNIQIVAVELQNTSKDDLENYIFENEINYPIIDFQNAYPLYKFAKNIIPNWGGQIPLMILFDKNHKALSYFVGVTDPNTIKETIKKYTGEDIETTLQTNGRVSN